MVEKTSIKEFMDSYSKLIYSINFAHPKIYDITARDFLNFAIEDSKGDDVRSRVNALGNVKRAIECRMDTILRYYWLHVKSEKENWDFPMKSSVLQELGIIAPRILKKINRKRNQLEHEYLEPSRDDVEDALDVAILFLGYTDRLMHTPTEMETDNAIIKLDLKKGIIDIKDKKDKRHRVVEVGREEEWKMFAKTIVR